MLLRRGWAHSIWKRGFASSGPVRVRSRIDLDRLENDLNVFKDGVKARNAGGAEPEKVYELGLERKRLVTELNKLREERNKVASVGKRGKPSPESIQRGKELKEEISKLEGQLNNLSEELEQVALRLPNWIDPSAPRVETARDLPLEENGEGIIVEQSVRNRPPAFTSFQPQDHIKLAEQLDIVDFTSPVSTSGQKFASFKNQGVLLELALSQWAIQHLIGHGFTPFMTPDLVHSSLLEGCGFQPRGVSSHVYRVHNEGEAHRDLDLCLVGTAEVPLAGFMAGKHFKLPAESLPKRMAGFGHCFRAEAGSTGAATKGLYRLHQFSKVEMFVFSLPEQSKEELSRLRAIQQGICEELGLPWRTIDMFPHELGNPAYRKFDVQVYMPSRAGYGEVASISNCTDYQARRLDIRFSDTESGQRGFVHTLNGTAIAIPRIVLAILENFQQADGSVKLPECLVPYMAGKTTLDPIS